MPSWFTIKCYPKIIFRNKRKWGYFWAPEQDSLTGSLAVPMVTGCLFSTFTTTHTHIGHQAGGEILHVGFAHELWTLSQQFPKSVWFKFKGTVSQDCNCLNAELGTLLFEINQWLYALEQTLILGAMAFNEKKSDERTDKIKFWAVRSWAIYGEKSGWILRAISKMEP